MNLLGILRDVHPQVYEAFVDESSGDLQRLAYKTYVRVLKKLSKGSGHKIKPISRPSWQEARPKGLVEYFRMLHPEHEIGRWLRQRPAAIRIGPYLFVHGGISPRDIQGDVVALTAKVQEDMQKFDQIRQTLVHGEYLTPFSTYKEMAVHCQLVIDSYGQRDELTPEEGRILAAAKEYVAFQGGELIRTDGPFWFRGYMKWSEEVGIINISQTCRHFGVEVIIAGHNYVKGGISTRFGHRVVQIDTGVSESPRPGLLPSLLKIENGSFSQVNRKGEETLFSLQDLTPFAEGKVIEGTSGMQADNPLPLAQKRQWPGKDQGLLPFRNDQEVLAFLQEATWVEKKELTGSSTNPVRYTLEKDGVKARAIFRRVAQEYEVIKSKDGRRMNRVKDRYDFEVAAYQLSLLLGLPRVPPVVIREMEGERGSLQLWLEGAKTEKMRREAGDQPQQWLPWVQRQNCMHVFDYLIFNTDRNQGNLLFSSDDQLWFIDHTRSFRMIGDPSGLESLGWIDRRFFQGLQEVTDEEIREHLKPYLSQVELKALLKRRTTLVQHFRTLLEQKAVEQVLFDF
jgi:hypothetical protein